MSGTNKNAVQILHVGYCRDDTADTEVMHANCTCTLIRTLSGLNIIVDTMTAWDGQHIIDGLQSYNLQPNDIDFVICTHGHPDHIGCNYLFSKAKWHIIGNCVHNKEKFLKWNSIESPFQLDDDVQVVATPGHTLSCVSVLIRNSNLGQVVGICGDLFERVEDIVDANIWIEAGSEDVQAQRKSRLAMAEKCNYIIPGHGAGFDVSEKMRVKLLQDTELT